MHVMQMIRRMPDDHPAVSSVLTGIWGLIGMRAGIMTATANHGQLAADGIFLSLIGSTLIGFACYTGYATDCFRVWHYTRKGTRSVISGHGFTRRSGPIILVLAFLELLFMLWLLMLINEIFVSRR